MKTCEGFLYIDNNNKLKIYFCKRSKLDIDSYEFKIHRNFAPSGDFGEYIEKILRTNVIYHVFNEVNEDALTNSIFTLERKTRNTNLLVYKSQQQNVRNISKEYKAINPLFISFFENFVDNDKEEEFADFSNFDFIIVMETLNRLLPHDTIFFPPYPINEHRLTDFWNLFVKTFHIDIIEMLKICTSKIPKEFFVETFLKKEQQFVDMDISCNYLTDLLDYTNYYETKDFFNGLRYE
jgi:hypothetical protein